MYGAAGILVLAIAAFFGINAALVHQYNAGLAAQRAVDSTEITQLRDRYDAALTAANAKASVAQAGYDAAKRSLDTWSTDHPPRVVRLCINPTSNGAKGDVRTGDEAGGTGAATTRRDSVGGVHGPDTGGGVGRAGPDIGGLLRDYGSASQDFVNALSECVER